MRQRRTAGLTRHGAAMAIREHKMIATVTIANRSSITHTARSDNEILQGDTTRDNAVIDKGTVLFIAHWTIVKPNPPCSAIVACIVELATMLFVMQSLRPPRYPF